MNERRRLQGLAAELWLIGRSYAASPERRDYGEKIEWTNSGNGLDTYFDLLAEKLWSDEYYNELKSIVENLENLGKYKFAPSSEENDKNILAAVITNVLKFNALLKEIRYAVDEKELLNHVGDDKEKLEVLKNNQKNMMSFSSKFLHFHFPDVVFIIDTITKGHFKGYGNPYEFKFQNDTSNIRFLKKQVNEMLGELELNNIIGDTKLTDAEEDYKTHCVREYLLAKKIVTESNFEFNEKLYIPRQLDTYMLIANSHLKKK